MLIIGMIIVACNPNGEDQHGQHHHGYNQQVSNGRVLSPGETLTPGPTQSSGKTLAPGSTLAPGQPIASGPTLESGQPLNNPDTSVEGYVRLENDSSLPSVTIGVNGRDLTAYKNEPSSVEPYQGGTVTITAIIHGHEIEPQTWNGGDHLYIATDDGIGGINLRESTY